MPPAKGKPGAAAASKTLSKIGKRWVPPLQAGLEHQTLPSRRFSVPLTHSSLAAGRASDDDGTRKSTDERATKFIKRLADTLVRTCSLGVAAAC